MKASLHSFEIVSQESSMHTLNKFFAIILSNQVLVENVFMECPPGSRSLSNIFFLLQGNASEVRVISGE